MKRRLTNVILFMIVFMMLSFLIATFTMVMAASSSTIPYGGVSHNLFELSEINNYVADNYPEMGNISSGQSIFVGARRWQNENFAVGVEIERISTSWRNSNRSAAEAMTTGYLATAYYRINDFLCFKGAAGAYSSRLSLFGDIDRSYAGLDFGYKVGVYLPVSTENLDDFLPFNVDNRISGDAYIGYRSSRVGIDNDLIGAIDYSGLEMSASLNISF
ncbi:hypothetical protein [Natronospora cellulosivora (SeqCode)]